MSKTYEEIITTQDLNSLTHLEYCIWYTAVGANKYHSQRAAAELAALTAELEAVKRERDELRIELQTTAKHKLLDGSFCWCDKVNFQFNPEYGHTASCYAHRVALKEGKA